jgi:hypothetical protein
MTRTPCPRAHIYIISPERNMNKFMEAIGTWNVTVFVLALRRCQPVLICDVKNIANDGKPFWARWNITEGLLSESGYAPEDEADEGNRNEVSHEATTVTINPHGTSDSSGMLSTHTDDGGPKLPVTSY